MPRSLRTFFFDYEPQDGATSPADYAYVIMLRYLLSAINSWPLKILDPLDTAAIRKRKIWRTILRFCFMCLYLGGGAGGALYVLLHQKSMTFFELGHLYISLLMIVVIFSRFTTICLSERYVDVARNFLENIHLFFYKERSEYSMKIHKQVHRISHLFTLYLVCQMMAGLTLFNVTPMYNNYSAGNYARGGLKGNATYEHALYFSYPFPSSTDLKWYIFSNILHWVMSYLCATWFCTLDCFLSVMVFHIWGHFKILLYNLENFPRPSFKTSFMIEDSNATLTCEMYSPNELKGVGVKLNELVDYHRNIVKFRSATKKFPYDHKERVRRSCTQIVDITHITVAILITEAMTVHIDVFLSEELKAAHLDFTDKMSDVFGPMLFVYYGFHQTSGCLLLLECSQMTAEALSRYLPLTIILFQQLIQLSIIFELTGSISGRLKDAAYGLPWECMDTKNRRTVAFFLMNVQEPVHVKALGIADVGVTSMTAILKTSISYFTFLNSM